MSQWARENPELMEEIARLPLREQNAAMRDAMAQHDVARIERPLGHHCHRDLSSGALPPSPGAPVGTDPIPPLRDVPAGHYFDGHCDVCGAPRGKHHLSYCGLRGDHA